MTLRSWSGEWPRSEVMLGYLASRGWTSRWNSGFSSIVKTFGKSLARPTVVWPL